MDCFIIIFFNKIKVLTTLLYFILLLLSGTTNEQSNRLYPKMLDLSNEKFLFVAIDGIYIFERNLLCSIKIYNFKEQQIIQNVRDINKTALSDITYDDNLYVFCLVKDYLYLFDNNKKKIIKELDLNDYLNGKLYSLNPFINGTYLSCIISYTEAVLYPASFDSINKLNIYGITFLNINENDQEHFISKREYFNKAYVDSKGTTYISKDSSTCQISSNILYCFYFIEDSTKVSVSGFDLFNNYEEINCNYIYYDEDNVELYEIKSYNPSNSNLIFLCYYGLFYTNIESRYYKDYYEVLYCISYKIQEKKLSKSIRFGL